MIGCLSIKKVIVIDLILVSGDLTSNLASIHPSDEIEHIPGHQEARILHRIRADTNMSLLNQGDSLAKGLRHFEAHKHDSQTASAERRHGNTRKL